MYDRYAGLIFDMDGTLLDTASGGRQAWRGTPGGDGIRFDDRAVVALNGEPGWRIAQAIQAARSAGIVAVLL